MSRLPGTGRHRPALAILALLVATLFASVPARAGAKPVLHFESNSSGDIALDARGVAIEQALAAVADAGGFDVWIEEGVTRAPVNVTLPMAPVEYVLRELLRGRNYALVYDGDDASLSRVLVLAPSTASRSSRVPARRAPQQRRPGPARKTTRPAGAIVIRQ